jgi:hypothetical protein
MTLAEPDRREQIESKLRDDGWWRAAMFAAYHQQTKNLKLLPWQDAPCEFTPKDKPNLARAHAGEAEAIALCRRLVAAGLSRWEPDPVKALAAAEARDQVGNTNLKTKGMLAAAEAHVVPNGAEIVPSGTGGEPPARAEVSFLARGGPR